MRFSKTLAFILITLVASIIAIYFENPPISLSGFYLVTFPSGGISSIETSTPNVVYEIDPEGYYVKFATNSTGTTQVTVKTNWGDDKSFGVYRNGTVKTFQTKTLQFSMNNDEFFLYHGGYLSEKKARFLLNSTSTNITSFTYDPTSNRLKSSFDCVPGSIIYLKYIIAEEPANVYSGGVLIPHDQTLFQTPSWGYDGVKDLLIIKLLCQSSTTTTDDSPLVAVSHSPLFPSSSQSLSYTATASDDVGLASIQIFVDGTSIGSCSVSGMSGSCIKSAGPYAPGSTHNYYAKATDSKGQVGQSSVGSFVVGGTPVDITKPVISVTSPLNNSATTVTSVPTTIKFSGTASDSESGIEKVEARVETGAFIIATPKAPGDWSTWSVDIPGIGSGLQSVVSRAVDKSGNDAWRWTYVNVTVSTPTDNPPAVSASHSPSSPTSSQTVTFTGSASDDNSLTSIELFVDGLSLGSCSVTGTSGVCTKVTGPYSAGSSHTYSAKAFDTGSNSATSITSSFTVQSVDNPPTISTSHLPTSPTSSQTVSYTATATDDIGLSKIEIFVDGVSVGSCLVSGVSASCFKTTGPYAAGSSHSYYARATDSSGQVTQSSTKSFAIALVDNFPTASISKTPASPTSTSTVTYTASATDDIGLASIKIFVDGSAVKTCTVTGKSASCSDSRGPYSAGSTHSFYASATDSSGKTSNSATSSFTVQSSGTYDFSIYRGVNYMSPVLRTGGSTTTSNLADIQKRMQLMSADGINFLRVAVYWDHYERNPNQSLLEIERIVREAGKVGIKVQIDNHHFHTGAYNSGNGFPTRYTDLYPLRIDKSVNCSGNLQYDIDLRECVKTSDLTWRFWQAYVYDDIPGMWDDQWAYMDKTFEAAQKGNDYGNWISVEFLNEPQIPPRKSGDTVADVYKQYGKMNQKFANSFKAKYGTAQVVVVTEANGVGNGTASFSSQHFAMPAGVPVMYAFHRYDASGLDDEFGTKSTNIVNNGISIGVDVKGRMVQEWALDGTGFGTSEADMTIWMSKFKQYNLGWSYWAAFGGNDIRNLYITDSSGNYIHNDKTYQTSEGTKYGGGKYFFKVMYCVYNNVCN